MRSPKVTVTIGDSFMKKVNGLKGDIVSEEFAEVQGGKIVAQVKSIIASGASPVKGYGKFEPYKNPEKYPGTRKPARPVNLSLTGDMLEALSSRRSGNGRLEIGILPDSSEAVKIRARVHNTGERDDIPMRRFIPLEGEEFVASVQSLAKDLFKKRILELLKG